MPESDAGRYHIGGEDANLTIAGDNRRGAGAIYTHTEPLLIGALLVGYSNGLTFWVERKGHDPEKVFRATNPALLAAMLLYASVRDGLGAVGLRRDAAKQSALLGLGAGAALSAVPLAFFHKPVLLDGPLEYGPVARMSKREMLIDVLVRVPIGIALSEELAFRGLLYSSLRRGMPARRALFWSAAAFALWHLAVTHATSQQTNIAASVRLPGPLRRLVPALTLAGGLLSTGMAGVAFGLLREKTGNLAGPVVAHWVVDGLMIGALWKSAQGYGVGKTKSAD